MNAFIYAVQLLRLANKKQFLRKTIILASAIISSYAWAADDAVLYDKCMNQNNGKACAEIGSRFVKEGYRIMYNTKNGYQNPEADRYIETGLELNLKACDLNNAQGCKSAALVLDLHFSNPKAKEMSKKLFLKACDLGEGAGCSLAVDLFNLKPEDEKLLIRGCKLNDSGSCNSLGVFYSTVKPVNHKKAFKSYEQACKLDDSWCDSLASNYYEGRGVAKNKAKAISLYKKACDSGNDRSCSIAAKAYETGDGVSKNLSQAKSLYLKACNINYYKEKPDCVKADSL